MQTKPEPLVSVTDLHVDFALRTSAVARLVGSSSGTVRAVDGVNIELMPGEVLGLVGESGSGKSTLGRALLGLVRPTGGSIRYRGQELTTLSEGKLRPLRRKLQMVFQDPHASLNPSMTVGRAISDALRYDVLGKGVRVSNVEPGLAETEFSEVRFKGDRSRAASVYEGMTPLRGEDVADAVVWCLTRPPHVNIQSVLILPTDQASAHAVHRRAK